MVLNEKQRKAKRKLIEDNRRKKHVDVFKVKVRENACVHDLMTDTDRLLISEIVKAYDQTNVTMPAKGSEVENIFYFIVGHIFLQLQMYLGLFIGVPVFLHLH